MAGPVCKHDEGIPNFPVRDLPEYVHAALQRRAVRCHQSLPHYLTLELRRLAERRGWTMSWTALPNAWADALDCSRRWTILHRSGHAIDRRRDRGGPPQALVGRDHVHAAFRRGGH